MNPLPQMNLSDGVGLDAMLRGVQRAVLKHPAAAQALFAMLVAEGKAFARTDEGRLLVQQLQRSEILRRLERVWDAASLWMLDAEPESPLPSGYLDALIMVAAQTDMEPLIERSVTEAASTG